MSKVLRLYNTFRRTIEDVKLNGDFVKPKTGGGQTIYGSFYICGPTVYSHSHLGHALTYTRADLFRRFMRSIFDVKLLTVMNITDIDDKILARAQQETSHYDKLENNSDPSKHPFHLVSNKYYKSFIEDMNHIRVQKPDITIKVTQQMKLITKYINKLERTGHAYVASNGDVYFDCSSVKNYTGLVDDRKDNTLSENDPKSDIRDFALWKRNKANEPVWAYKSDTTNQTILGRPGWHVQCSAIASALFGKHLDFHFGGRDLVFPHHYNEQACCCAYHDLDTSKNLNVWCHNWLHSGHLVLRDEEKMSKSLGNTIGIRDFIDNSSVNAIRLLCIHSHYRANIDYNSELLDKMKSIDHKLSAFCSYVNEELVKFSENDLSSRLDEDFYSGTDITQATARTKDIILEGVCEDFNLAEGLLAILDLSKQVYNCTSIKPDDMIAVWQLLNDWFTTCGLEYGPMGSVQNENLVRLLREFRQNVRSRVIDELKDLKRGSNGQGIEKMLASLLESCDDVRSKVDALGFVIRDKKS